MNYPHIPIHREKISSLRRKFWRHGWFRMFTFKVLLVGLGVWHLRLNRNKWVTLAEEIRFRTTFMFSCSTLQSPATIWNLDHHFGNTSILFPHLYYDYCCCCFTYLAYCTCKYKSCLSCLLLVTTLAFLMFVQLGLGFLLGLNFLLSTSHGSDVKKRLELSFRAYATNHI